MAQFDGTKNIILFLWEEREKTGNILSNLKRKSTKLLKVVNFYVNIPILDYWFLLTKIVYLVSLF